MENPKTVDELLSEYECKKVNVHIEGSTFKNIVSFFPVKMSVYNGEINFIVNGGSDMVIDKVYNHDLNKNQLSIFNNESEQ